MRKLKALILGAVFVLSIVVPAQASLIGSFVDITSPHGNCMNIEVGAGVECTLMDDPGGTDDNINIDISASSIVFSHANLSGINNWAWSDVPSVFDIVIDGLTWVDSPTTPIQSILSDFDILGNTVQLGSVSALLTGPNQITYTNNEILMICDVGDCSRLTVDITPAPHAVPTPSAFLLMGTGLLGLIGYCKWSTKNS